MKAMMRTMPIHRSTKPKIKFVLSLMILSSPIAWLNVLLRRSDFFFAIITLYLLDYLLPSVSRQTFCKISKKAVDIDYKFVIFF